MNRTQQKFKFFTDLNEDKIEKKKKKQPTNEFSSLSKFFLKKIC